MKQKEQFFVSIKSAHRIITVFCQILLGEQYTKLDIKDRFKEDFRLLKEARIYSPKIIDTIMQLFEGALLENDEKKPILEMILSKLEALLNDNKTENDAN
ncbi:MAG: hypothetical protein LBF34_03370 [Puniceicoccales bacterium]|nr:hypothetical protein [Puniceicoccales bacterium]